MRPIWWFYVTITCTVQGDIFIYWCTVTRGSRLMNIQSPGGKVLTATAALISLLERCKSVNRQQSLIFLGGGLSGAKMVMMSEACEWWRNLWTVLQYWQAESVKYDTCFQKSSNLPWRLKFRHLGASGYQIYFPVNSAGRTIQTKPFRKRYPIWYHSPMTLL